jgi:FAD/FMN-containing dehydrogenase
MTVSPQALAVFRAEIGDVEMLDDLPQRTVKSRDYYWYSPILKTELDDKIADLIVRPRDREELRRVVAAAARARLPITPRGGGTGNYGQAVPLEGGIVLEMTKLDRILALEPGRARCEGGLRIERLEKAAAETGQMLAMFPSTKRVATMAGFFAGGSGGIGSLRHGMLRDGGNVPWVEIMTVEEEPRLIELSGADVLKTQHAYGTNGIITALDVALMPAKEWVHCAALFDGYEKALRFAAEAQTGVDCYLMTPVERRFSPYYKKLGEAFPADRDAVFAMIAPEAMADFRARVAKADGQVSFAHSLAEMEEKRWVPAWELGWNHTTLHALKHDKGWTYLQVAYPRPFDPALVARQMARYGEEMFWHHEMAREAGQVQIFALPLVRFSTKERLYQIISQLEKDGCVIYDPHAVTIEDGGMKAIDDAQIAFKREADPYGLLNPGKTRGWTREMARP